jgi:DNA-directed RNA polymerase subunit F
MNKILQKVRDYSKLALGIMMQGSGTAALYFCTAFLLAAMLTGAYLTYAWNLDKEKWYKVLAVLRGDDIRQMEQSAQEQIFNTLYDDAITRRAERLREDEFQREVRQRTLATPLPPESPPPPPMPTPSDAAQISAYERRINADRARAQADGLAEQTRLIENMEPEQAKEVIRKLWSEGANQRVLTMLLDMSDRRRGEILYTMQQDNAEELKDLCEILQRIGDGEPAMSRINEAARTP